MNSINNNLDGWLVINKDLGMTSRQVVNIIKKTLNVKKIGHAGTLDPLATGVLALAVGRATKTVKYIMDGLKNIVLLLNGEFLLILKMQKVRLLQNQIKNLIKLN